MVSVGWLGVVFAKLVLGLAALTTASPTVATALYVAMNAVNVAFPPVAIGTVVTGVLLSLGTKWGLLQHYWVATKLVLTVGVIVTAVQLTGRIMAEGTAGSLSSGADVVAIIDVTSVAPMLMALAVVHLIMLGFATVLSVYKPWGRLPFVRTSGVQIAHPERA
jgi:hypothetical protein